MSLLIRHNKEVVEYGVGKERSTVVLEKPHVLEILQEMRKQFTKSCLQIPQITVNIGSSYVHPGDQFNKRLGRSLAQSRMKPVVCTIKSGSYENMSDAIYLVLEGVDDEHQVKYDINVKIYRDSGEMRVMHVFTRSWE